MTPRIPFIDLYRQNAPLENEISAAISRVIQNSSFIAGEEVAAFESEFAAFCEAKHCVGVANGTDALRLAMEAVGVGPGWEVITVAHTFIASAEAAAQLGATVRFVDIDPATATMDPSLLEAAINERTRAIVPVHLYGRPADMDPIMEIARRHGVAVIEDAAQAHGARYKGRLVGTLGDAACFSFFPSKNLGALGDAGAVTTNNESIAHEIRRLSQHGSREKYVHEIVGWNARLDGLQAAALRVKLRSLARWNVMRRHHARRYDLLLGGVANIETPAAELGTESVFHLYVVRVENRDGFREALAATGVDTAVHYPEPVHRQQAFADLAGDLELPVTEAWARSIVSLPMFPELERSEIDYVCAQVAGVMAERESVLDSTRSVTQ